MKCPGCRGRYGVGSVLKTAPGTPFDCNNCGASLKIDGGRAALIAVIAVAFCLLPLTGFLRSGWELFWILGVCGAAFYAYASQAVPHDPEAVLRFSGWFSDHIEVWPTALRYKERRYPYDAVTHLARFKRKARYEYLAAGEYVRLRIYLKGMVKPITLQNRLGLLFTGAGLEEIYRRVAEKTFQPRIQNYLAQLQSKGYFEYGGARFGRAGEVSRDGKKVNLRLARLSLEPFLLIIDDGSSVLGGKLKIDTEIDQDVLLALLQDTYGITFAA